MAFHSIIPFWTHRSPPKPASRDPFSAFRAEMENVFDRFFDPAGPVARFGDFQPSMDVQETDTEIRLKVDLPGIDEKDIELEIEDDMLRLSGERHEEKENEGEERRYVERRYGRFERMMRLPFAPADSDVQTEFRKGVLSVRIKRPEGDRVKSRRIPIGRTL
ncbi:MAG: Hsp20/alpha crystallin family protein [Henriciella sp.]